MRISVRVPAKLHEQLQALADADNRSLAAYITLALQGHVQRIQSSKASIV